MASSVSSSLVLSSLAVALQEEERFTPAVAVAPANPNLPEWRRQIVVWLKEVAHEYSFTFDTLCVAVNYFDRLLSRAVVPAAQLQTNALACILIASKQHERCPLGGADFSVFAEICDVAQLHTAELNTLHRLGWDVNSFTPSAFVQQLLQLVSHPPTTAVCARALEFCDLALLDSALVAVRASVLGTAAIACACAQLNLDLRPLLDGLAELRVVLVHDEPLCQRLNASYDERARARSAASTARTAQQEASACFETASTSASSSSGMSMASTGLETSATCEAMPPSATANSLAQEPTSETRFAAGGRGSLPVSWRAAESGLAAMLSPRGVVPPQAPRAVGAVAGRSVDGSHARVAASAMDVDAESRATSSCFSSASSSSQAFCCAASSAGGCGCASADAGYAGNISGGLSATAAWVGPNRGSVMDDLEDATLESTVLESSQSRSRDGSGMDASFDTQLSALFVGGGGVT